MKTMYYHIAVILIVLLGLPQVTRSQSEDGIVNSIGIFVGSGLTRSGTHSGVHYSISHDIVLEGSYGVDFAIIPFWAVGAISSDKLYGVGLNWYPIPDADFMTSVKSVFQDSYEDSNMGARYHISASIGYSARVHSTVYTFLKYGATLSFSKTPYRQLPLNLEFGVGFHL